MVDDLKIIKKYYGERMSHLCRELFPTLLEEPGFLSNLLLENFEPNRLLYEDIVNNSLKEGFKNYIYGLTHIEEERQPVTKTPKELLSEAGYDLYECQTEEDIQKFMKYYARDEELCTFDGGRLNRCHVFFAVKKNVDQIHRKDLKKPRRQDEYGTSVISIQFTRGEFNTLSIKNRYNHTVNNPDATFSNNLDNIILGLSESFEQTYGFNLSHNKTGFEIPGYVKADKYYKYNYEGDNVYYCTNNLIIDNFQVNRKLQQMERYILFDYFVLDLQEKKLIPAYEVLDNRVNGGIRFHHISRDTFCETIGTIKDIKVVKNKSTGHKIIYLYTKYREPIEIEINKSNQMIRFKHNNLRKVPARFLCYNNHLEVLELRKAVKIEKDVLLNNKMLQELILPNIYQIGENFLYYNNTLRRAELPATFFIEDGFMGWDQIWGNQPIGVKNKFVKFLTTPSLYAGPISLLHMLVSAITKQTIKLSNRIIDKQEVDFTNDEITITSIKKSGAFSALINHILSNKEKELELEQEEKGIQK